MEGVSDCVRVMTVSSRVSGEQFESGEDGREEIEKRESLEKESDSLKVRLDKEGEGEGMHKVDNLKTRMKRQHSDTFILKNRIKETKTVRELVERYKGWGKESGTFGSAQEPFKFGQKSLHSCEDGL